MCIFVHRLRNLGVVRVIVSQILLRAGKTPLANPHCRVKWGDLERPHKSSVKGKLQVKFSVSNVSVN